MHHKASFSNASTCQRSRSLLEKLFLPTGGIKMFLLTQCCMQECSVINCGKGWLLGDTVDRAGGGWFEFGHE